MEAKAKSKPDEKKPIAELKSISRNTSVLGKCSNTQTRFNIETHSGGKRKLKTQPSEKSFQPASKTTKTTVAAVNNSRVIMFR